MTIENPEDLNPQDLNQEVSNTEFSGAEALNPEASDTEDLNPETSNPKQTEKAGDLEAQLEAILMVIDEPVSIVELASALQQPETKISAALASLKSDYAGLAAGANGRPRGFELREIAGGWRIYVRPEYDSVVKLFVNDKNPSKLSQAALETLAVIAYKQPITRSGVSAIRAVNVDSVVRTLLGRGLIAESHTDSETGAIYYETTDQLLEQLGINSLEELPPIAPLLPDSLAEVENELR